MNLVDRINDIPTKRLERDLRKALSQFSGRPNDMDSRFEMQSVIKAIFDKHFPDVRANQLINVVKSISITDDKGRAHDFMPRYAATFYKTEEEMKLNEIIPMEGVAPFEAN